MRWLPRPAGAVITCCVIVRTLLTGRFGSSCATMRGIMATNCPGSIDVRTVERFEAHADVIHHRDADSRRAVVGRDHHGQAVTELADVDR